MNPVDRKLLDKLGVIARRAGDAILEIARTQVEGGAHALDISVAVTERTDEAEMMGRIVKLLATGVEAPLVIDTTEPEVMESALKIAPGRCLLNSTHLETPFSTEASQAQQLLSSPPQTQQYYHPFPRRSATRQFPPGRFPNL